MRALRRQIAECESIHGARATYALKEQIHRICRLPQLWQMDAGRHFPAGSRVVPQGEVRVDARLPVSSAPC